MHMGDTGSKLTLSPLGGWDSVRPEFGFVPCAFKVHLQAAGGQLKGEAKQLWAKYLAGSFVAALHVAVQYVHWY